MQPYLTILAHESIPVKDSIPILYERNVEVHISPLLLYSHENGSQEHGLEKSKFLIGQWNV